MKVALVGYGKMGRVVEELAPAKGMDVVARFTRETPACAPTTPTRRALAGVAVLVDFSVPEAVARHGAGRRRSSALPLVIGTTGWRDRLDEVRATVEGSGASASCTASNFSLGVNVLYRAVEQAARILSVLDGYDPFIHDWHHRFKLDSPSGTALELQRRMARVLRRARGADHLPARRLRPLRARGRLRLGGRHPPPRAPGRNRQGLAEGALLAAKMDRRPSRLPRHSGGPGRSAAGPRGELRRSSRDAPPITSSLTAPPYLSTLTTTPSPFRPPQTPRSRPRLRTLAMERDRAAGWRSIWAAGASTSRRAPPASPMRVSSTARSSSTSHFRPIAVSWAAIWRVQDAKNYEEFYLRPHQSGNPDATPVHPGLPRHRRMAALPRQALLRFPSFIASMSGLTSKLSFPEIRRKSTSTTWRIPCFSSTV